MAYLATATEQLAALWVTGTVMFRDVFGGNSAGVAELKVAAGRDWPSWRARCSVKLVSFTALVSLLMKTMAAVPRCSIVQEVLKGPRWAP
jgi:hypothetical protein